MLCHKKTNNNLQNIKRMTNTSQVMPKFLSIWLQTSSTRISVWRLAHYIVVSPSNNINYSDSKISCLMKNVRSFRCYLITMGLVDGVFVHVILGTVLCLHSMWSFRHRHRIWVVSYSVGRNNISNENINHHK